METYYEQFDEYLNALYSGNQDEVFEFFPDNTKEEVMSFIDNNLLAEKLEDINPTIYYHLFGCWLNEEYDDETDKY